MFLNDLVFLVDLDDVHVGDDVVTALDVVLLPGPRVESLDDLEPVLKDLLEDGDLVLTMGAGDIGAYAADLPTLLAIKPTLKVHS